MFLVGTHIMTTIDVLTIFNACLFNIFIHLYFYILVEKWFKIYTYIIQNKNQSVEMINEM